MVLLRILVLWAAGLGAAAQFAKIAVIFPELQVYYGRTDALSGFLLSLISFMGMALGVVAGHIAGQLGLKRLLLAGMILGAVVSLFQSTLPGFHMMLASRLLEGFSHLAIVVAAPTLIAQLTPARHQGLALTFWGTFFGVAFALFAFLAKPVVNTLGLPGLFGLHGAGFAALALIVAVLIPGTGREWQAPFPNLRDMLRRHHAVYSSPFISAPALGWFFYTLTFVSMLALLPPLLDESVRAATAAAMSLVSIASSLIIGGFLLRFTTAITVVLTGFAAALLVAVLLSTVAINAPLAIALFAALGLVQGASFAAVPQLVEAMPDRALANGGLAQTGNLGNLLGTPVALAVLTVAGPAGLPAFLIVCYIAAIGVHLLLARARLAQQDTL